jgi:pilus assembly protein TadC
MKFKDRLYYRFAKIFPINYRNHLAQQIIYTGEFIDVHIYLGSATLLAFLALFGLIIAPKALFLEFNFTYFFYGLLAFILIQLIAYMAIYFKAEDRTKRVEAVLPDALQLIASNIHAGMTPFQALKSAERKEFGPLREEIHHAIAQSMGTESFAVALNSISKRINSEMLERALKLFTTSMQSGGHLAILLEELAKDIQATRNLKNE